MINLSNHSYLGNAMRNPYHVTVNIGKYTSIAEGLNIWTAKHPMGVVSNYPFYEKFKFDYPRCSIPSPIRIGSDVWLGHHVTIVDAVTIGDGVIIGAESVVGKDIPSYAVAVGNPVKIIRYRFTDEQISALLKIKWWDWIDTIIKERIEDFKDIDTFIVKYG